MRHLIYGMGLALSFILGAALRPPGRPIWVMPQVEQSIPLYLDHKIQHDGQIMVLVENSLSKGYENSH